MRKNWFKRALATVLSASLLLTSGLIANAREVVAEGASTGIPVLLKDGPGGTVPDEDATVTPGEVTVGKKGYIHFTEGSYYAHKAPLNLTLDGEAVTELQWFKDDPSTKKVVYTLKHNPHDLPLHMLYDTEGPEAKKPVITFDKRSGLAQVKFNVTGGLEANLAGDVNAAPAEVFIAADTPETTLVKFTVTNKNIDKADSRKRPFVVTVSKKEGENVTTQTLEATRYMGSDVRRQFYEFKIGAGKEYTVSVSLGEQIKPTFKVKTNSEENANAKLYSTATGFENFKPFFPIKYFYDNNKDLEGQSLAYRIDDTKPDDIVVRILVNANLVGSSDFNTWYYKQKWYAYQATVINFILSSLKIAGEPIQLPPLTIKHYLEEENYETSRLDPIWYAGDNSVGYYTAYKNHWQWCQEHLNVISKEKQAVTTFQTGPMAGAEISVVLRSVSNQFLSYQQVGDNVKAVEPNKNVIPKWPLFDSNGNVTSNSIGLKDPNNALGNTLGLEYEIHIKNAPQRKDISIDAEIAPSSQGYMQVTYTDGIKKAYADVVPNYGSFKDAGKTPTSYQAVDSGTSLLAKSVNGNLDGQYQLSLDPNKKESLRYYPQSMQLLAMSAMNYVDQRKEIIPRYADTAKHNADFGYANQFVDYAFEVADGYIEPKATYQQFEMGNLEQHAKPGDNTPPLMYGFSIDEKSGIGSEFYYNQAYSDSPKNYGYKLVKIPAESNSLKGIAGKTVYKIENSRTDSWEKGLPVPRYGIGNSMSMWKNDYEYYCDTMPVQGKSGNGYYDSNRQMLYFLGNLSGLQLDAKLHQPKVEINPDGGTFKGSKYLGIVDVLANDLKLIPKEVPQKDGMIFTGYLLVDEGGNKLNGDKLYQPEDLLNYGEIAKTNPSAKDGQIVYSKLILKAQYVGENSGANLGENRGSIQFVLKDGDSETVLKTITYEAVPGTQVVLERSAAPAKVEKDSLTGYFDATLNATAFDPKTFKKNSVEKIYYSTNPADVYPVDGPDSEIPSTHIKMIFKPNKDKGGYFANGKDQIVLAVKKTYTKAQLVPELKNNGVDPKNNNTDMHFVGWNPDLPETVAEGTYVAKWENLVIPNPSDQNPPSGYVRVTYNPDPGSISSGQLTHFDVLANTTYEAATAALRAMNKTVPPEVTAPTGKSLVKWDEPEGTTLLTENKTITAIYADSISEITNGGTVPEGFVKVTFTIESVEGAYKAYLGAENVHERVWAVDPKANKTLADINLGLTMIGGYKEPSPLWNPKDQSTPAYVTSNKIDKELSYLFNNAGVTNDFAKPVPNPDGTSTPDGFVRVTYLGGEHGNYEGKTHVYDVAKVATWTQIKQALGNDFPPEPTVDEGWSRIGWDNEPGPEEKLTDNRSITALYKDSSYDISENPDQDVPEGYVKLIFEISADDHGKAYMGNDASAPKYKRAWAVDTRVATKFKVGAFDPQLKATETYILPENPWTPGTTDPVTTAYSKDQEITQNLTYIFNGNDATQKKGVIRENDNTPVPDGYKRVIFQPGEGEFEDGQPTIFDLLGTATWEQVQAELTKEVQEKNKSYTFPPRGTKEGKNFADWDKPLPKDKVVINTALTDEKTTYTAQYKGNSYKLDDPTKDVPSDYFKVVFQVATGDHDKAYFGEESDKKYMVAYAAHKTNKVKLNTLTPPDAKFAVGYGYASEHWGSAYETAKDRDVEANAEYTLGIETYKDVYKGGLLPMRGKDGDAKPDYIKVVFKVSTKAFTAPDGVTPETGKDEVYFVAYVKPGAQVTYSSLAPDGYKLSEKIKKPYIIPSDFNTDEAEGWKPDFAGYKTKNVTEEKVFEAAYIDGVVINSEEKPKDGYYRVSFVAGANGKLAADDITHFDVSKDMTWSQALDSVVAAKKSDQELPPVPTANEGYNFIHWLYKKSATESVTYESMRDSMRDEKLTSDVTFNAIYAKDTYRITEDNPFYPGKNFVKVTFNVKEADRTKAKFGDNLYTVEYAVIHTDTKSKKLEEVSSPIKDNLVVMTTGFHYDEEAPWGNKYNTDLQNPVTQDVSYDLVVKAYDPTYTVWGPDKSSADKAAKDKKYDKIPGYVAVYFIVKEEDKAGVKIKDESVSPEAKRLQDYVKLVYVNPTLNPKTNLEEIAPTLTYNTGFGKPEKGPGSGENDGWDNSYGEKKATPVVANATYTAVLDKYKKDSSVYRPGYKAIKFIIKEADRDEAPGKPDAYFARKDGKPDGDKIYEVIRYINPNLPDGEKVEFVDINYPRTIQMRPSYEFDSYVDKDNKDILDYGTAVIDDSTADEVTFTAVIKPRSLIVMAEPLDDGDKEIAEKVEAAGTHYKVVFKASKPGAEEGWFTAEAAKKTISALQEHNYNGRSSMPADGKTAIVVYVDKAHDPWSVFYKDGKLLIENPTSADPDKYFVRFAKDGEPDAAKNRVPKDGDIEDNYSFTAIYRGDVYVDPTPENPNDDVVAEDMVRIEYNIEKAKRKIAHFTKDINKNDIPKEHRYQYAVYVKKGTKTYKETQPGLEIDRKYQKNGWRAADGSPKFRRNEKVMENGVYYLELTLRFAPPYVPGGGTIPGVVPGVTPGSGDSGQPGETCKDGKPCPKQDAVPKTGETGNLAYVLLALTMAGALLLLKKQTNRAK